VLISDTTQDRRIVAFIFLLHRRLRQVQVDTPHKEAEFIDTSLLCTPRGIINDTDRCSIRGGVPDLKSEVQILSSVCVERHNERARQMAICALHTGTMPVALGAKFTQLQSSAIRASC